MNLCRLGSNKNNYQAKRGHILSQHKTLFESHNKSLMTISDEHMHLVDLLNTLLREVQQKPINAKMVAALLDDIYKETSEHFSHEDDLMFETGYPQYLEHQQHHTFILGLIKNLIDQVRAGNLDVETAAKDMIEQCMVVHFEKHDRDLIILLSERF